MLVIMTLSSLKQCHTSLQGTREGQRFDSAADPISSHCDLELERHVHHDWCCTHALFRGRKRPREHNTYRCTRKNYACLQKDVP